MNRRRGDEVSYMLDGMHVSMPLPDIDLDDIEDIQNRHGHREIATDVFWKGKHHPVE